MSRTKKGKKPVGYEYWSKRNGKPCGLDPGPESKKRTHRHERREGKKVIKEQIDE